MLLDEKSKGKQLKSLKVKFICSCLFIKKSLTIRNVIDFVFKGISIQFNRYC